MIEPLAALLALAPMLTPAEPELFPWLDFRDPIRASPWRPVHDGVMGGVSRGSAEIADGAVRFAGRVSLENDGGFASFRLDAELGELVDSDGLRLRLRGDGRIWRLSLRADDERGGVGWQASLATVAGEWIELDVAFTELLPTRRGRLVRDPAPLDLARVRQVGLVLADGREGPFELELAGIAAWRARPSGDPHPGTRAAALARTADLAGALEAGLPPAELVDALRWSERLLVLSAPEKLGPPTWAQLATLVARADELVERDLRLVLLAGDGGGRLAGRGLSPDQVDHLRRRWELPAERWALALVGKDGGLKSRWTRPVELERIFELIDAMPMRRREAGDRAAGR